MNNFRKCPCCNFEDNKKIFFEFSEKYLKNRHRYDEDELSYWLSTSDEKKIHIVQCTKCNMIYTKNKIDFEEMTKSLKKTFNKPLSLLSFKEKYENVTPTKLQISIHTTLQLIKLMNNKKELKILDFGGGSAGVHSRIANFFGKSRCYTYDITIEENDIDGVKFVNNIKTLEKNAPFDIIFCNEVLEHCLDPKKEIESIYRLLSADGYAVLSVPLFNYNRLKKYKKDILRRKGWAFKNFHLGHINYYSPKLFVNSLKLAKFKIVPVYIDFRYSRLYDKSDKKNFIWFFEYLIRYFLFRFFLFFNYFPNISNIVNSNFVIKK